MSFPFPLILLRLMIRTLHNSHSNPRHCICSRGNIRWETLRAFSFDEMKKIIAKMV